KHQRVRVELPGDLERLEAAGGGAHFPALHAQRHGQQVGEHLFVVDGEDAQRGAVGAVKVRLVVTHEPILRPKLWNSYGVGYASSVRSGCSGADGGSASAVRSQMELISASARSVIAMVRWAARSALPVWMA